MFPLVALPITDRCLRQHGGHAKLPPRGPTGEESLRSKLIYFTFSCTISCIPLSCHRTSLLSQKGFMHPSVQPQGKQACFCCYQKEASQCSRKVLLLGWDFPDYHAIFRRSPLMDPGNIALSAGLGEDYCEPCPKGEQWTPAGSDRVGSLTWFLQPREQA